MYESQAFELAERLREIREQDWTDPVDIVVKTMKDVFVTKIIEGFTHTRVYTTQENAVEYPKNAEELYKELAWNLDENLPIRVEKYRVPQGYDDTLVEVDENPEIIYQYTPSTDTCSVWTVTVVGKAGSGSQPQPPMQFPTLKACKNWFESVLKDEGIVAKPALVPMASLTRGTMSAEGYAKKVKLARS